MAGLDRYRLLGRSGLRVSPLCLGTMAFGIDGPAGADLAEARRIVDAYADAGGNVLDTANLYAYGRSEEMLGDILAGRRERFVIGSKYSFGMAEGAPLAGGNSRRNMVRAVEDSLSRLRTDYIDIYWLHFWEFRTPIEEVMRAFDDLVRAGKILYPAISDTPAWKIAEAQTLARQQGMSPLVAVQAEYSLVERGVEHEIVPMAAEHGLTVMPWGPLSGGVLSGKYTAEDVTEKAPPGSRKFGNQMRGSVNPRNLAIAEAVAEIAKAHGAEPAQVAIAWLLARPGRPLPILGPRTEAQLTSALGALDLTLSEEDLAKLEEVSRIEPIFPGSLYARSQFVRGYVDKGVAVEGGYSVKYD